MHSLTIIALPHQRIVLSAQISEQLIQSPHIHLQVLVDDKQWLRQKI
jgi:hypothetical protein